MTNTHPRNPMTRSSQPILELRKLTRTFGALTAVNGIDLDIAEGEFFTIVGPSGSGKTTMLRMLAGMEQATSGDMVMGAIPMPAETSDTARLRWASNQPVTVAIIGAKIAAVAPPTIPPKIN